MSFERIIPRKEHEKADKQEREEFLKKRGILDILPKEWNVVCEDESIFIYDSVMRAVWALKGNKGYG